MTTEGSSKMTAEQLAKTARGPGAQANRGLLEGGPRKKKKLELPDYLICFCTERLLEDLRISNTHTEN